MFSVEEDEEEDDYDIGDVDEEEEEEEDDYDMDEVYGEDDDDDDDLKEPVNPYPLEGKYKNEKDRAELENMPEMQRESILFERSQELRKYNDKKLLAQRAKQNQAQKQRSSSRSQKVKESSRSVKSSKLSELKKQREKKNRRANREDYEDEDDEDDEEEDPYDLGDDEDEDTYEPEFNDYGGSDVKWAESSKRKTVELSDINRIKTGHSIAEKFCFYPGFSTAIVGTFGRISVAKNDYRMVKIEKVIHAKPYTLGNIRTDQYFVVSQPGKDTKSFNMNYFSDEKISEAEFAKYNQYISDANAAGKRASLPSLRDLEDKYQELKQFASKKLEGTMFEEFIRRKSMFNDTSVGANYVLKKSEFEQKLQVAKDRSDFRAIKDYSERLRKLESHFQKSNPNRVAAGSSSDQFAKLNEKNRKLNMRSVKEAELINSEKRRTGTTDKSDPFRRLTTRSRMYYQEIQKEENEKAKNDAIVAAQEASEKEAKEKLLLKQAKYRNLGEMDRLISAIDFKFDITI